MKVTIDWNKWYSRATLGKQKNYRAKLLTKCGRMCCIGIDCSAHGVSNKNLLHVPSVDILEAEYGTFDSLDHLIGGFCEEAYPINDSVTKPPDIIVTELLDLCHEHNINWEFTNVPKKWFYRIPEEYHDRVFVRK